jgi:hypothetical protein
VAQVIKAAAEGNIGALSLLIVRASCKIPIVDDAEGYFGVNSLIVYSAIRARA